MLEFTLPDGSTRSVRVTRLLNAGYSGRDQAQVAHHVEELAALGVPAPTTTPALYPVAPYLAAQTLTRPGPARPHVRRGGVGAGAHGPRPEDVLLTAACDHTDRALEVHGVAWSKNASLDALGRRAWRLIDVVDHLDEIRLRGWVRHGEAAPKPSRTRRWRRCCRRSTGLDELARRDLLATGTVLLSGTVAMFPGVDQFADGWTVRLEDPVTGEEIEVSYAVDVLPEPVG